MSKAGILELLVVTVSLLSARETTCKVIGHTWDWSNDVLPAGATLDSCPDCQYDVDENETRQISAAIAAKRDHAAFQILPQACDCSNVVTKNRYLGIERYPRYVPDGHCAGTQHCHHCKLPYRCQPLNVTVNVLTKRRLGEPICEPFVAVPEELSAVWRFEGIQVTVGCKCALPSATKEQRCFDDDGRAM